MAKTRKIRTFLDATAAFSPCALYRYTLSRVWDADKDRVVFCMLNPSTATAEVLDPTVTRCVDFAVAWGYGGLVVVNIFALRSTDPDVLRKAVDPVGPDNDVHLAREAADRLVVCAWGNTFSRAKNPLLSQRASHVLQILRRYGSVRHLGLTQDGQPRHPLYLKGSTRPQPFS